MDDALSARAAVLCKLPMVRWDRCVRSAGTLVAYGWIRGSRERDFVVLSFLWPDQPTMALMTTSSARHSREMTKLLYDSDAAHVDCERVGDVFDPELLPTSALQ